MFPLWTVLGWLVELLPAVMFHPARAGLFWGIVLLVAWQYRRVTDMERAVYGTVRTSVFQHTLVSVAQGLVGGLIGSVIIIFLGVTITGAGLPYLLPVALLLMLINPRFLCFSYAGGIVSVVYLLFGVPRVSVAGVMGLVAALHATESLLILLSGSRYAQAIPLRLPGRRPVGAFSLQKFWPIPIVVLWLTTGAVPEGGVAMPDWWPLIKPAADLIADGQSAFYDLLPVVAVLGYADIAISSRPERRPVLTAGWLMVYSIVLMVFAILASRTDIMLWPAALFGPLGHEAVIRIANRREFKLPPWLTAPETGVRIHDVINGSVAWKLGLRRGDVITRVNGEPVRDRSDLMRLINESVYGAEITFVSDGQERTVFGRSQSRRWGFLAVPDASEVAVAELGSGGVLTRLVRRWLEKARR